MQPPLLPLLQAKILFRVLRLGKTAKNFSAHCATARCRQQQVSHRCLSDVLQLLAQTSSHKSTLSSLASSSCIFPKLFLGSDSLFCLPRAVAFPSVSIARRCRFLLSFCIASRDAGITSAVSEEQRGNGTSHWSLLSGLFSDFYCASTAKSSASWQILLYNQNSCFLSCLKYLEPGFESSVLCF